MLSEGVNLTGESGKKYLVVSTLGQSNVWTAVELKAHSNTPSQVVVIKEPGEVDTQPGWPSFQNEMVMHEVFKDSPAIRQQLDRIPPTKPGEPPMIVLEITETTLWNARTKRPMSLAEIKTVAKDVLLGLQDIHAQGLVYADLKPQNIMVDGFNAESEAKDTNLSAKLGDLGIVMAPMNGTVQPITYRAPEVFLKGDITSRVDVWGWALIYCHMLEARTRFSKTGLYDDLETATGSMTERAEAVKGALTNDYKLQTDPVYSGVPLPQNDPDKHKGDQWELLRQRGLENGEVDFLRWVLRADPYQRPTVTQILECGWLDKTEEQVAAGFTPPEFESLEFDPKRATPEEISAQAELEAATDGSYFKQHRPMMPEKRLHSVEEEKPVKKTFVTNSDSPPKVPQQKPVAPSTFIPYSSSTTSAPTPAPAPARAPAPVAAPASAAAPAAAQQNQVPATKSFSSESRYAPPATRDELPPNTTCISGPGQSSVTTQQDLPPNTHFISGPSLTPAAPQVQSGGHVSHVVGTNSIEQPKLERPKSSTKNTGTFLSYS